MMMNCLLKYDQSKSVFSIPQSNNISLVNKQLHFFLCNFFEIQNGYHYVTVQYSQKLKWYLLFRLSDQRGTTKAKVWKSIIYKPNILWLVWMWWYLLFISSRISFLTLHRDQFKPTKIAILAYLGVGQCNRRERGKRKE